MQSFRAFSAKRTFKDASPGPLAQAITFRAVGAKTSHQRGIRPRSVLQIHAPLLWSASRIRATIPTSKKQRIE